MADITVPPTLDENQLRTLGVRMQSTFLMYKNDRRQIEEKWLQNLRQFRGIYDPGVLSMIPADRSKAYPRMTAWMVKGTVARLMQIAFPSTEKNYGVRASPLPDLSKEQLQSVLDTLVASKGGDPKAVVLTDEEIEAAILAFAKGKAEHMETKVADDLMEMDYITLARKVVRSAVTFSMGVLKGPLHTKVAARTWKRNEFTGAYTAEEVTKFKPLFEFVPVWNYYPDLTATSLQKQDGEYERHIMTREEVQMLISRPDFLGARIAEYLRTHLSGNYQAEWFESVIKGEPKSGQAAVQGKESRKFQVLSYWGGITGAELRGAGGVVSDADLSKMFHANVWTIDNLVIKAKIAPLGDKTQHYHIFVYEDDELSIVGNGLPETLRDSQLSLCEVVRAALDNASVVGPMVEVNVDMLAPGADTTISKHKTWPRESQGGASDSIPAVRNISVESHIPQLMNLAEVFLQFGDKESGLPPAAVGDTTGGGSEALRTSKNASMFLGAAALPIRDTLRNFDIFTRSVVMADVEWNKKYDPNPIRDGDHDVIARGSTSLVAKEVLAQSLNEFRASITPDEAPHLNVRKGLIARMKANDLPEDLLETQERADEIINRNAQMQEQQQQLQSELVTAQIQEILTSALENEAKAKAEGTGSEVSVLQVMLDSIAARNKAAKEQADAVIKAHQAETARTVANKPTGAGAK